MTLTYMAHRTFVLFIELLGVWVEQGREECHSLGPVYTFPNPECFRCTLEIQDVSVTPKLVFLSLKNPSVNRKGNSTQAALSRDPPHHVTGSEEV